MMHGGDRTPTLEEAGLPEFRGATLYLASASASSNNSANNKPTANASEKEMFVDIVDLSSRSSSALDGGHNEHSVVSNSEKLDPPRKRQNHQQQQQLLSPESDTLYSASPSSNKIGSMEQGYFSSRDSMLQRAVLDCRTVILQGDNGPLLGSWLLTLVDHWDNEKERLVLLCGRALFIFKYDFIALMLLDYDRIPLSKIAHLIIGNLEYPSRSITPKVQQIASRVSTFLRDCLQQLGQEAGRGGGLLNLSSTWRNGVQVPAEGGGTGANIQQQQIDNSWERAGARISWNVSIEPKLTQMWNPWSKDIPWITFVSHPLLTTDQYNPRLDVQDFLSNLRDAVQVPLSSKAAESSPHHDACNCLVEYRSILMESYVGLPALVHNYGQFGYYKNRGKISF